MPVPRLGVELALVFVGLGIFVGYHVWFLYIQGKGAVTRREFNDYFGAGKLARVLFAQAVMDDEKEAITAVQTCRNAIMACTFISAIAAVISTAIITVVLDEVKMKRITEMSEHDPIAKHANGKPIIPPEVVLSAPLAALFAAFVCTAQSVRLYAHLGFFVRAVPSRFNVNYITREEAMTVALRAGLAFTVGLRCFYFFIPLILWVLGPTALFLASVLLTFGLYHLDRFPREEAASLLQHHGPEPVASTETLLGRA